MDGFSLPVCDRCWLGSDDRVLSDMAALLASWWLLELHSYPEDGSSTWVNLYRASPHHVPEESIVTTGAGNSDRE
jgi:hypothetical protein